MAHKATTGFKENEIQLARFAKALGHPARIAILKQLANMNCCFCGDIVEELPLAQATVSQHLKELKESGLIQGSIEPPKVRYCIDPVNWMKAKKLILEFFTI
ncbi:MAG: metalloregulator ArsR/SmtB family transcription factor [Bacteroidota bacterium]